MSAYRLIHWKYFYLFLISVSYLSSCSSSDRKTPLTQSPDKKSIITGVQKLAIPDGLESYSPFKNYLLDTDQLKQNHSPKIYSYVNASCPSCIGEILFWKKNAAYFMTKQTPVILVFYSKDNFEYIKHLCETGEVPQFPFPFFLDTKNQFSELNPSFKNAETNPSVLVDNNYVIVMTGNPLHSKKVRDDYFQKITDIQDQH